MSRIRWDKPLPPLKWSQVPDPDRFKKTAEHLRDMPTSGIRVGTTLDTHVPVFITPKQLSTHMQVVGSTGLGKSYFLEGLIKSLILQGRGVCLIDPHGDLYHRTLEFCAYLDQIQPQRQLARRVIPFDIAERRKIIGFNPIQRNARVMTYQVLALMEAIRKVWGQDSFQDTPRLARWLFNAAYGVIDANLTLVQTQYMVDPKPSPYRDAITQQITNPRIKAEWEWFSSIKDRDRNEFTESSYNRLQPFVIHEIIRLILGQQTNTLDFTSVLSGQKILLVNLAKQSTIPEDYQHLIGTLLVNEIMTAAFARKPADRTPFFLMMDEFQHFVTKDMCEILDGGRKFGLHLILAHQHLNQLREKDPEVYYSTMGNARIKTVFGGLIDEDLEVMAKEFYVGELEPDEVKNEVWQTKFRPVESSRTIITESSSDSSGESYGESTGFGEVSHSSLARSDSYIPGSAFFTSANTWARQPDSTSLSRASGSSRSSRSGTSKSSQSSSNQGTTVGEVPWYEYHEYRELSSREFRSLEEQIYIKKAQMKRQSSQHAAIMIPDQRVQLIKAPTIKEHVIDDRTKEDFKQACFELSGCYKTPEEADRELGALEQKLLTDAKPVIEVHTEDSEKPKRKGRGARPSLYATIKKTS